MTVLRATARYDAWWKKQNLTEKLGKKFSRLNKFKILGYQFTWCPIQSLLDSCLLSYSLIFFWNWLTSHQITDFVISLISLFYSTLTENWLYFSEWLWGSWWECQLWWYGRRICTRLSYWTQNISYTISTATIWTGT